MSLFSLVQNRVPPPNIPAPMPPAQYAQPQPQTAQIPQSMVPPQPPTQQVQPPPQQPPQMAQPVQQQAPPAPQPVQGVPSYNPQPQQAPGYNAGGLFNIPGFEGGVDEWGFHINPSSGGNSGGSSYGIADPGYLLFSQLAEQNSAFAGRPDLILATWQNTTQAARDAWAGRELGTKTGANDPHNYAHDYYNTDSQAAVAREQIANQLAISNASDQVKREQNMQALLMSNNDISGRRDIANQQNALGEVGLTQARNIALENARQEQMRTEESAAAQAQNFFGAMVRMSNGDAFKNWHPYTGATAADRQMPTPSIHIEPGAITNLGMGGPGPNIPAPIFARTQLAAAPAAPDPWAGMKGHSDAELAKYFGGG